MFYILWTVCLTNVFFFLFFGKREGRKLRRSGGGFLFIPRKLWSWWFHCYSSTITIAFERQPSKLILTCWSVPGWKDHLSMFRYRTLISPNPMELLFFYSKYRTYGFTCLLVFWRLWTLNHVIVSLQYSWMLLQNSLKAWNMVA